MRIRDYAKSIGFEVVGKLKNIGKRGLANRWYMDEAGNKYIVDICIGDVQIVSNKLVEIDQFKKADGDENAEVY